MGGPVLERREFYLRSDDLADALADGLRAAVAVPRDQVSLVAPKEGESDYLLVADGFRNLTPSAEARRIIRHHLVQAGIWVEAITEIEQLPDKPRDLRVVALVRVGGE